jgi:uncharacterized phosphosugar-binding protein
LCRIIISPQEPAAKASLQLKVFDGNRGAIPTVVSQNIQKAFFFQSLHQLVERFLPKVADRQDFILTLLQFL